MFRIVLLSEREMESKQAKHFAKMPLSSLFRCVANSNKPFHQKL
jgi:hypothetical protein